MLGIIVNDPVLSVHLEESWYAWLKDYKNGNKKYHNLNDIVLEECRENIVFENDLEGDVSSLGEIEENFNRWYGEDWYIKDGLVYAKEGDGCYYYSDYHCIAI